MEWKGLKSFHITRTYFLTIHIINNISTLVFQVCTLNVVPQKIHIFIVSHYSVLEVNPINWLLLNKSTTIQQLSTKFHTSRELITYKCTSQTFHRRFENDQQSFQHVLHRSLISPVSHHCIWIIITCSTEKLGLQDIAASTVLSEFGFIQKYWSLGALVVEGNYNMTIVRACMWNETITQSLQSSTYCGI